MMTHRIRTIQGRGHEIVDNKGVMHSRYDERHEAEEALEKLKMEKPLKEHELPEWKK